MSLCATGMPVSGCASPEASRSSAARACSRLFSASRVMKALRRAFSSPMRARNSCVSSTLEIFLAPSAPESSVREALSIDARVRESRIPFPSLDDLGNQIQVTLRSRGDRLKIAVPILFGDAILAQARRQVLRMGHRLDAFGVDRLHGFDQFEYVVQLALGRPGLAFAQLDAGEVGDAPD